MGRRLLRFLVCLSLIHICLRICWLAQLELIQHPPEYGVVNYIGAHHGGIPLVKGRQHQVVDAQVIPGPGRPLCWLLDACLR